MKKIILNESQLKKILNEGKYDQIKLIYNNSQGENVKSHQPAKLDYDSLEQRLYKAMKGIGSTDVADIRAVFDEIPDLPSLNKLINTFGTQEGENLLQWLDGDINYDDEWNETVYIPFRRMEKRSQELQHSKYKANEVKIKIDEGVKYKFEQKFPCLKGTPGYKVTKATVSKSGQEQLFFSHDKGHNAITIDGTAWSFKGGKYVSQKGKVSCPQTADNFSGDLKVDQPKVDQPKPVNEQMAGLEGSDGEVINFSKDTETAPETKTSPETKTDAETKKVDTPEKSKVVTKLMTGNDVKEIQTILHKQGFGDIVGSVDGKLGPKTLAGIKKLFLGVTRPKIEAITLQPKGIKSVSPDVKTPELAVTEGIQKNFKRFL